ncbi:MAG: hypothetical protein KBT34_00595 [Prevotella sp.]|nr:hypothetical protein [Candidatus Prevotella equi]
MQKIKNIILSSLLTIGTLNLMAQTAVLDYELLKSRNPWLTADNASALTTYGDTNVVKGTAYIEHTKGETGLYSNSSQANTLGAGAESFFRLSKKVVGYGSISYLNRTENDVTGTAFLITDDVRPFDILLNTAGSTSLERINIHGGLGWKAWKGLSLGAAVDYTTASYAKRKDLRYVSSYMNLAANVGASYDFGCYSLGAAFLYRRNTEDLSFKTYGTTDVVYTSLIDYANGMGISETFNGDGFTNTDEQPLFSDYKGVSAQFYVQPCKRLSFFVEGTYLRRKGYYGKESQFSLLFSEHQSNIYGINGRLSYNTKKTLHWLSLRMNVENLTAWQTIYTENTVDGVRSYHYYDPLKIANKVRSYGDISYSLYITPLATSSCDAHTTLYAWVIKAGTMFDKRKQTAYLFPDQTTVNHTRWTPYLDVTRNFLLRDTSLITAQLGFEGASGRNANDPVMCIFPDNRFGVKVKVGYDFPLKKVKGLRPNISVSYFSRHNSILGTIGVMYF